MDPIVVPASGYLDLGDLPLHEVDAGRLAAKGARGPQESATTVLEGRVLGPDGKPRAGQFVFVYRDEGMIGRPESMARTGADGEFALTLSGGGKYYIGARSRHGGPRQPGEWAGKLAGAVRQRAGRARRQAGEGFDDSHGAGVVKRARRSLY